jgi:hypothetical protein
VFRPGNAGFCAEDGVSCAESAGLRPENLAFCVEKAVFCSENLAFWPESAGGDPYPGEFLLSGEDFVQEISVLQ